VLGEGLGINAIIFSELFHKLSRLFDRSVAMRRGENIISHPLVEWLGFERKDAKKASEIAECYALRINDAMIAQQALKLRVAIMTDNVKDFRKLSKLKIIALR